MNESKRLFTRLSRRLTVAVMVAAVAAIAVAVVAPLIGLVSGVAVVGCLMVVKAVVQYRLGEIDAVEREQGKRA